MLDNTDLKRERSEMIMSYQKVDICEFNNTFLRKFQNFLCFIRNTNDFIN